MKPLLAQIRLSLANCMMGAWLKLPKAIQARTEPMANTLWMWATDAGFAFMRIRDPDWDRKPA